MSVEDEHLAVSSRQMADGRRQSADGADGLVEIVPTADRLLPIDSNQAAEAMLRLAAIVESSDDAIIGKTLEGTITSWNAGAEQIYGYSASEAIGRHISMLVPSEVEESLEQIFESLRRGERVSHFETVRVTKDGRRINVSLTVSPVKDGTGRVIGASAIARDITERKVLEEKLRRQTEAARVEHEMLAALVANVDVSLIVFDARGRLVLVNEAWVQSNGIPREAATGRRYDEILNYPVAPEMQANVDRVLATGEPLVFREWYYEDANHPNGVYIDGSIAPIRDEAGKVTGARAASVDVTEKVRARQAVEAQRALLETVIAEAPVGIVVYDRDMRILHANEEYARISRFDRDGVIGRVLYDVAPGVVVRKDFHKRLLAGETPEMEYIQYQFPGDDEPTYTEARYRPIRDENGAVTGILSILVDVTERTRNEERLRAQQGVQEALIEATPVGMIYLDRHMRVVDINAAYARMAHLDQATVRGQIFYDLAPDLEERRAMHARVLAGESIDVQNVPYMDAVEKRMRYYDIFYRPVKDGSGEVTGVVSAVLDVTEHMELDRHKDEFLSIASHELRTPVTSIKGFAQLALRTAVEQKNDRLLRPLRNISEQSNHLTRLINDLLDVSRTESGTLPLHIEKFDMAELLREVVSSLDIVNPDVKCRLDLPGGPAMVNADRGLIQQVVNNLLENAVKYSRDERKIEVRLSVASGQWPVVSDTGGGQTLNHERSEGSRPLATVSVRDFGVGIPEDQQAQVFERFFRARNAGYQARNGMGLGLYIAQNIVTRHGGRMWLESARDVGSTFYFALPALP
ncbi:MAG: PAS domain-containing protein [Chloroflexia bacterium]